MTRHTILLIQVQPNQPKTRQWEDYETVALAVEAVIAKYEQRLKQMNPSVRNIHYDINDLQKFIDTYAELCCLVHNPVANTYEPHDRDWFKLRVFNHLKKQAAQGAR